MTSRMMTKTMTSPRMTKTMTSPRMTKTITSRRMMTNCKIKMMITRKNRHIRNFENFIMRELVFICIFEIEIKMWYVYLLANYSFFPIKSEWNIFVKLFKQHKWRYFSALEKKEKIQLWCLAFYT